ncbi:MAG: DNA/RNA non-specific endonuclease [Candidatus Amulumruptor sp.]|nr:DNA/RNA non-specific endonuclease [Candidatus Amulumruptor sp.]
MLGAAAYAAIHNGNVSSRNHTDYSTDAESLLQVVTPDSIPSTPVSYTGFNLSFNPKMHIPNWVAWELTADETGGKTPRTNKFVTDPNVPGCAETYDYLYSGYDRGHMAPAADMKWDATAMAESFTLTNICPQAKQLNTGAWRTLEEKCRQWAQADSAIIIISGPILTPAPHEYIGDSRVAVPRSFFKVILSPYARPMRGIAFVMPNGYVKGGMQSAATSIDKVEELTGLDFFSALPDSIEQEVEAQNDFHMWSTLKPGRNK